MTQSLPTPPVALENICSVIHDDVLYTYSAEAFQSLPLKNGGEWEKLTMGVSVEGAACVGSTPADAAQAGFYVVGGQKVGGASDSACGGTYRGLQKYTYASKTWESICPTDAVTQDRKWHGATYIPSMDSILVYAGQVDGVEHISSQTFTIKMTAPFLVSAYESSAPPAVSPLLLPWSDSQAVMVGGDEANKRVMIFGAGGWEDSKATLADPLPKRMRAAIVNGDDGSRNLYTFDTTQSPNVVNRIVLFASASQPMVNSATITPRDLTLDSWPSYNASLAPDTLRPNPAIAQSQNGMVVLAGNSADDVLCIFDAKQNHWNKAEAVLGSQSVLTAEEEDANSSISPSSTPVSASATSASATDASATSLLTSASSSPAAAASSEAEAESTGMNPNAILGICLGTIIGFLLMLGLVLVFIRRYQRKKFLESGLAKRISGSSDNEKGGSVFERDSLPPAPTGHFTKGHKQAGSDASITSIGMLMGRLGKPKASAKHPPNHSVTSSDATAVNRGGDFKSTIGKPMLNTHPVFDMKIDFADEDEFDMKDDKAVSFAPDVVTPRNNGPLEAQSGNIRRSSGWNRYWSGGSVFNSIGAGASKRGTVDSSKTDSSHYPESYRITQDSATMPSYHQNYHHHEPPPPLDGRPELNRVVSGSPTVAQYPHRAPMKGSISGQIERPMSDASSAAYSSGVPDNWDPEKAWTTDRPAPQVGVASAYSSYYHPSNTHSVAQSGLSQQPQLAMADRSSDLSWLNIGEARRI